MKHKKREEENKRKERTTRRRIYTFGMIAKNGLAFCKRANTLSNWRPVT
jgi:hypothetical protein